MAKNGRIETPTINPTQDWQIEEAINTHKHIRHKYGPTHTHGPTHSQHTHDPTFLCQASYPIPYG